MFKILKNLSFVLALAILAIPFVSLADEGNTTQQSFQAPKMYIKDLSLSKTNLKVGDMVIGSFLLENYGDFNESDIFYKVSLDGEYKDGLSRYTYDSSTNGPVYIKAKETKKISFSYTIPDSFLNGDNLGIKVRIITRTGAPLSFADVMIKVAGGSGFASLENADMTIGQEKFAVGAGPIVKKGEKAFLNYTLKNSTKNTITFAPRFTIFEFTNLEKPISEFNLKGVSLKAGETKSFSDELPNFDYKAGVYSGNVEFLSGLDRKAPTLPLRYIVGGDIITIHSIKTDNNSVRAGDEYKVTVSYTGNPVDIRQLRAGKIASTTEQKYALNLVVKNETGEAVSAYSGLHNFGDTLALTLDLLANVDAKALTAEIVIKDGEKILASYTTDLSKLADYDYKANFFYDHKIVVGLLSILALLIAVGLALIGRKRSAKLFMILALVSVIISAVLAGLWAFNAFAPSKAKAFTYTAHFADYRFTNISVNAISNKTVNQSFGVSGSVSWWACSNTFENLHLMINNNGGDSRATDIYGDSSNYYYTGYSDFSFSNFTAPSSVGSSYKINISSGIWGQGVYYNGCQDGSCGYSAGYQPYSVVLVNGTCGSANGVAVFTAPTTNLCSAGTASGVSGTGPWSWTCTGSGGGSTANCSAPLATVLAPASFTATALSCGTGVSLSWASSTGATSYKVYRDSTLIATTSARIYTDNSILTSDSYIYYVIASGLGGDSPASNSATVSYLATCGDMFVSCTASTTDKSTFTSPVTVLWKATTTASSTTGYSWTGTDGLSGSSISVSKNYTIAGLKKASTTASYTKYGPAANVNGTVQVLVVGGGAGVGGGVTNYSWHAGGGGGQVSSNSAYSINNVGPLTMSVSVGSGGGPGVNGGSSVFGSITALGGSMGYTQGHGGSSGSGNLGGTKTPTNSTTYTAGAGGGGAGGVGSNSTNSTTGAAGGLGVASSISGTSVMYGAGGKGGDSSQQVFNGTANTGTGGGGITGSGGSGVVIVKYNPADFGTVTGGFDIVDGSGLKGEYFDNLDFTTLKVTRVDSTVNFSWGAGTPDSSISADSFSVRWSGYVKAQYNETYTFFATTDDGVRLWVNGVKLIDNWVNQGATEKSGTIALEAGKQYSIVMEYFENAGDATAILKWSSPSTAKQVIPTSQLMPLTDGQVVIKFPSSGTITFNPKIVANGTASVTVPCPGVYVVNSSDDCTNCDTNPNIVILPPNPVHDPLLDCSSFVVRPGATSSLNTNTTWTVGSPTCPSCYSEWVVDTVIDNNSTATKTLRYIPTTVGVKNISVSFGSTTASTTGTYGNPCRASTTVTQTGGGIIEI